MTTPRSVKFNTLERAIASDLNAVGALAGKAALDTVLSMQGGMNNSFEPSVSRGLAVTPNGMVLSVLVQAGEAYGLNTSPGADQSAVSVGVLAATTVLSAPIGLPVSPATQRFDVIYGLISSADDAATSETRQILVLPTPTVSSSSVYKRSTPVLTLAVAQGVEAGTPVLPTLPAGAIPICALFRQVGETQFTTSTLFDMRKQHNPFGFKVKHEIESGFRVFRNDDTHLGVTAGSAWVEGAYVSSTGVELFDVANILTPPLAALAGNTGYHIYLITRGNGAYLGNNVATYRLLLTTVAPNEQGRPSSALTYWANGTVATVSLSTSKALYLGQVYSTDAFVFETGDIGRPLSKDGFITDTLTASVAPGGLTGVGLGLAGRPNVWLKRPVIQWLSVSTVRVPPGFCFIRGVPILTEQSDVNIASAQLIDGAESASTMYYVYVRRKLSTGGLYNISRQTVTRISSLPPNLDGTKTGTAESGFTSDDYLFVGSVYNNASSDFQDFILEAGFVRFLNRLQLATGLAVPINPTRVTAIAAFSSYAVATPRIVEVNVMGVMTPSIVPADGYLSLYAATGEVDPQVSARFYMENDPNYPINLLAKVAVHPTTGEFELARTITGTSTMTVEVHQTGYCDIL